MSPGVVGCAGWSIPRHLADRFPVEGTHLERYGRIFSGVEINSSFYRSHRQSTYSRWGESVPADFRFAVKAPKSVTHQKRLNDAQPILDAFLDEVAGLGDKLGCMLVQLPPSLAFEQSVAESFFDALRTATPVHVACEPRHVTWFTPAADELLSQHKIARVAADPALIPDAARPGGWPGMVYYRWHGSPRMYYSSYDEGQLQRLTAAIRSHHRGGREVWCIFDNTALGAASENAAAVQKALHAGDL